MNLLDHVSSDSNAHIEFFIQQYLEEQYAPTPIADLFGFKISQDPYLYLTVLLIVAIICMQYQFRKINLVWSNDWRINSQSEAFSDSKWLFFLYYKLPLIYSTSMAIVLPIIHNFYLPREIHITPPSGIEIEDYYYQIDVWSYFEVMLAVVSLLAMYKLFVYMNELQNRVRQISCDS